VSGEPLDVLGQRAAERSCEVDPSHRPCDCRPLGVRRYLVYVDEDAQNDFNDWVVEEGCMPSEEESKVVRRERFRHPGAGCRSLLAAATTL